MLLKAALNLYQAMMPTAAEAALQKKAKEAEETYRTLMREKYGIAKTEADDE